MRAESQDDLVRVVQHYAEGDRDFSEAHLEHADLRGRNLDGIVLDRAYLTEADLSHCWLGHATLSGASLRGARLIEANLLNSNLRGAWFNGADITAATLSGADLSLAHLDQAMLTGANFDRAVLDRASMLGAQAVGASFVEANLGQTVLTGANLSGANLRRADLRGTSLREVNLDGANLMDVAIDSDATLLVALWDSLRFGDRTFARRMVLDGKVTLPIGQPNPLRLVFGIDRELDADDMSSVRALIRKIEERSQGRAKLEVSVEDSLVVEAFGSASGVAEVGAFLALLRDVHRKQNVVEHGLVALRQDMQADHEQQLSLYTRDALQQERLFRLVESLYLRQIELQDAQEAERFATLVRRMDLGEDVSLNDRIVTFGRDFLGTQAAVEFLLAALGLGGLVPGLKAMAAGTSRVLNRTNK